MSGKLNSGWLLAIAANLVTTGTFFDLAVRDVEMALAAYTLARLTEVRQAGVVPDTGGLLGLTGQGASA